MDGERNTGVRDAVHFHVIYGYFSAVGKSVKLSVSDRVKLNDEFRWNNVAHFEASKSNSRFHLFRCSSAVACACVETRVLEDTSNQHTVHTLKQSDSNLHHGQDQRAVSTFAPL